MIRIVVIILFTFILTSRCSPAFAEPTVGEVTSVTGDATLERGGHESAVTPSMPIQIHDRLTTIGKAELTVTFHDASKLILAEPGSYEIDQYTVASTNRIVASIHLWVGHLRAIVSVVIGAVPDFQVYTPNAVASVRGTEFETAYIKDRPCPEDRTCMRYTTVEVFHGVVAVANSGNPAQVVQVDAGYETTVACESPATSPAPLGMKEMGAPGYH